MQIVILPDADQVADYAAHTVVDQIDAKPDSVLGLATGSTPGATYDRLIQLCQAGRVSFRAVRTFNLDEYLGLPPDHPQSYRYFMDRALFRHIDIRPESTHVPDGLADDPQQACDAYERDLRAAGGIDLQLLGLGRNGHIGFNEPTSSLASRTRVKTLAPATVRDNARFFDADEFQPELSITMGIGTIMEARAVMLLATGEHKAEAVARMVEGAVSAACPASVLQFHPRTLVVVDEAAGQSLALKEFYQYTEQQAQRLAEQARGRSQHPE